MSKKIGAVLVALMMAGAVFAFAGQGLETMVLPVKGKYGAVRVPHWDHQAYLGDCNACHGLFPQEKGVIGRMRAESVLKKKRVMNNCRSCHRSTAKAGKASGPIKCFDCHAAE